MAKNKLTTLGHALIEKSILDPDILKELHDRAPESRTVPQIFTEAGERIGGYDDLIALISSGKFAEIL